MKGYNIIEPVFIYLVTPIAGLIWYLILRKKMRIKKILNPPGWELFVIFFTYGGLLTVVLTVFFWQWSGMASLGTFYLILLAPIAMLIIANKQYRYRTLSNYHKWMFNLGSLYFVIAPIIFAILLHLAKN